jgi:hypothetical protein
MSGGGGVIGFLSLGQRYGPARADGAEAIGEAGVGDGGLELGRRGAEVRPALLVDRHDQRVAEVPGGLDRELRVEGQVDVGPPDLRHLCATGEEDDGVEGAVLGDDLGDQVGRGVVAADVDARQVRPGQHEADHRAVFFPDSVGRAVVGGDGDDPRAAFEVDAVAGIEADRPFAEPLRAGLRRQHQRHFGEQLAAAVVEVVGVVVVGDQDDVDRQDVGCRDRRADELVEGDRRAGPGVVPGLIEGRVGEEPQRPVLDQRGRPADQGQSRLAHPRPPLAEPLIARSGR